MLSLDILRRTLSENSLYSDSKEFSKKGGKLMRKIQIAILLVSVLPTSGKVIYVDTDAAGAKNGTSWVDSYNYLQDALRLFC